MPEEISRSTLTNAILESDLASVKAIYQQQPELFQQEGSLFNHPLFQAASHGCQDICAFIVEQGISINTDDHGRIPMLWPALHGNLGLVQWFVEHGSLIDGLAQATTSPLYSAIKNGHTELAAYLIEQGADVNFLQMYGYETPLDRALKSGNAQIAAMLKARGAKSSYWPDDKFSEITGGGILEHVAELGRLLPVPLSKDENCNKHLRLAIFGKGYGKEKFLLFTHGLFACHQPMLELFMVLPGGWFRLDETPQNQFPIFLLEALYQQVQEGRQITEEVLISAEDETLCQLPWPEDICGFWPVDNNWGLADQAELAATLPPAEAVTLYTLLPVKRTRKAPVLNLEKNRAAKWDKLTLKIAPNTVPL